MKKAIICLGLGLAAVESSNDFLSNILTINKDNCADGYKSGEAYAKSDASNVSESYAVNGGVKANNINSYEKTGGKTGTKVSSNSSTTTYNKANIDLSNNNKVQSGTTGCDDLSFSNDYGCNDNCEGNSYGVNLPSDSCNTGSAIEEGCGSTNSSFGAGNTDFGNYANYGINNNDSCYADEDHFGKATDASSTLANATKTASNLGGLVFGDNTNKAVASSISKVSSTAVATGNKAPVIVNRAPVINQAPVIVNRAPVINQAPVIVNRAPVVNQAPVIVQNGNDQVAVNKSDRNLDSENNSKVVATKNNAAINKSNANNAATYNSQKIAKNAKSANQNDSAALNNYKNIVNKNDKINSNSALARKKNECSTTNLDKDHLCHANDCSLHKEEHCADEQSFQHEDSGKVKTLECTHIVECVTKDCSKGESAKRQIWTKKKSCAKKHNDKRAVSKNMHKACHKNADKQAFKQAIHKCNNHKVEDYDQDASATDSKLSTADEAAIRAAASSNQDASSCNDASSNNNIQQSSSANSENTAASSNDVTTKLSTDRDDKNTNKNYVSSPIETC